MKHHLLTLLAAGAAIFATVSVVRTQPLRETSEPPSAPPASTFPETVAAVGLVEAGSEHISVGTPIAGVVAEVTAAIGQAVTTGTPLFRLETRHLEASLAVKTALAGAARARLETARSTVADLADRVERSRRLRAGTVISEEELVRNGFALRTAEARLAEAAAEVVAAEAEVQAVRTEIARCTVAAPIDGTVLQSRIRPGEFAAAGPGSGPGGPLMILGNLSPLHLRVDVDEHEAWRIGPASRARAHVRGNAGMSHALEFVRIEPFVIPKRSLTGDSIERVDTRVLQVIYRIAPAGDGSVTPPRTGPRLHPGQQMDVFIEAGGAPKVAASR
jgi:multidrug efflux pump subunit AcrA (membrane-fusion protein)